MQGGTSEAVKPSSVWDRWPGKFGVPLLTCVLGVLLKDGCDRYHRKTQTLDYFVVPTSSLIQRPNLGDRPLSVTVDGRAVENLSTATFYLANRSDDDYDNVPVEVSFSMPDGKPVELLRETVMPERVVPTNAPSTAPAGRITRRYTLGVANRQRANEALIKAEYVFANATAPDVSVYVDKKGLVAEPQQLLRKEDLDKWGIWLAVFTGWMMGMLSRPLFRFGDRLMARVFGEPKDRHEKK